MIGLRLYPFFLSLSWLASATRDHFRFVEGNIGEVDPKAIPIPHTRNRSFECPAECQECCVHSKKKFKCVLRVGFERSHNSSKPVGRRCGEIQQREQASVRSQAKVVCEFERGEYDFRADPTNELFAACSKRSRCCCDSLGVGLCVGDSYHLERLKRSYHFTHGRAPILRGNGLCPVHFSPWQDGETTPCKCDVACGIGDPGNPPEPRAPASAHRLMQMLSLASAIYEGEPLVSGWKLEKIWDVAAEKWGSLATDYVGIYRREFHSEKHCALAFAGTDDFINVVGDVFGFVSRAGTWCGWGGVHSSFANDMRAFMRSRGRFEEFDSFLADPRECNVVIAVGHSLGGALAELMAACANRPDTEKNVSLKARAIHFQVHEMYTFGACAVSTEMLTNRLRQFSDGCFPGARVFLEQRHMGRESSHWIDPVANYFSLRPNSLVHPKTTVVALTKHVLGNEQTSNITQANVIAECSRALPEVEPGFTAKSRVHRKFRRFQAPWGWRGGSHLWRLHPARAYYDGLAQSPDLPDLDHRSWRD